MTWKMFSGAEVDHAKEIELVVSDFDTAVELLTQLGCVPTSYQENRRESWACDDVKITIDSWPFLKPFVEIEGPSEALIEAFSRTAGFDWSQAQFCSVARLYRQVHGTHVEIRQMPRLTFEMQDPFRAA